MDLVASIKRAQDQGVSWWSSGWDSEPSTTRPAAQPTQTWSQYHFSGDNSRTWQAPSKVPTTEGNPPADSLPRAAVWGNFFFLILRSPSNHCQPPPLSWPHNTDLMLTNLLEDWTVRGDRRCKLTHIWLTTKVTYSDYKLSGYGVVINGNKQSYNSKRKLREPPAWIYITLNLYYFLNTWH